MPPRPMLPPDDLYARLELPADATFEAVEIAWRALLKRHHPDVAGPGGDWLAALDGSLVLDCKVNPAVRAERLAEAFKGGA